MVLVCVLGARLVPALVPSEALLRLPKIGDRALPKNGVLPNGVL